MRGANLATLLASEGHRVTVGVQPGSELHLPANDAFEVRVHDGIPSANEPIDTLIVDTFADGFRDEWNAHTLARFSRRVLCARYRQDGVPAVPYDEIWLPYCEAHDEWQGTLQPTRWLGLLARRPTVVVEPVGRAWVVYDPGHRLEPRLRSTFARLAAALGRPWSCVDTLSHVRNASKMLCVGAGYNTVYELLRAPLDVRFLPLERRYDDQTRRARMLGRDVGGLDSLRDWLTQPCEPSVLRDAWYADACGVHEVRRVA